MPIIVPELSLTYFNFSIFNITRVNEIVPGTWSFTAKDGDQVGSTSDIDRCEAQLKTEYRELIPVGYVDRPTTFEWKMKLPNDFTYSNPGSNNFLIMGQWQHGGSGSPMLSMRMDESGGTPRLGFRYNYKPNDSSLAEDYVLDTYNYGEFISIKAVINFTTKPTNGYVKIYVNGTERLSLTERATRYEAGIYGPHEVTSSLVLPTYGIYRGGGWEADMTNYISDVKISV